MAARLLNPFPQYQDINGVSLVGAKLQFFENGTTIPKDIFSDLAGTLSLGNEIIMDSRGAWPDFYGDGTYRVRLLDANDVQLYERDDIFVSAGSGVQFVVFNTSTIYSLNDIVKASDNNYYISIVDPNVGNDPLLAPSDWSQINLLEFYNATKTYSINNLVLLDGVLYRSKINTNLDNSPDVSPSEWDIAVRFSALGAISALEDDDTFMITDNSASDDNVKISWADFKTEIETFIVSTSPFVVASSYGTNGFVQFSDGRIEQWGTSASITRGSNVVVTLPTAFPNNNFNALAIVKSAATAAAEVHAPRVSVTSLTQITIAMTGNASGSFPVYWRAIGN